MSPAELEATSAALALGDIKAGYGGAEVLRDISLDVPRGTVVALLGPNGAGKTTLMRVAAGLLKPTAGSIRIAGKDVTREPAAKRVKWGVCLIPEGRGVFPSLTVRENVSVLVPPRRRSAAIDTVVEAFPTLADRLAQVVGTMSGGQQQMVAMARCYLAGADVILLDEVSIGLAPLVVDEIYQTIHDLARRGTSLLIVEQYVDRVLAIADQMHVLNRGALTFSGSPDDTSRDELMERYMRLVPQGAQSGPDRSSVPANSSTSNQE